jgi:hypothetical protein
MSEQLDRIRKVDGELEALYRKVFNNVDAEIVLEDLRSRFFYNVPSTENHFDANKTMFNEGSRAVLIHIDTMLLPETKPPDTAE